MNWQPKYLEFECVWFEALPYDMKGVIAKKICEKQKHGVMCNFLSLKDRSRGLKDYALEAFESRKAEGNGKIGNWFLL